MPGRQMKSFMPSNRVLTPKFSRLRDAEQEDRLEVSIYFKPRTQYDAATLPTEAVARKRAVHAHRVMEHETDVLFLREFAEQNGLTVTSVETERRLVKVAGTVSQLQAAFKTRLGIYTDGKKEFHGYEGSLQLPDNLVESVESVLGLDNRPIAKPQLIKAGVSSQNVTAHWPNQVGALYNFPTDVNGSGQCISLIELGGGYYPSDTASAFSQMGLATPTVVAVSVDGATNSPDGSDADGEVALDIQTAGGSAPGARIAVYFAPNTFQGFADAITQAANDTANNPSVMSISWGAPEVGWGSADSQAIQTMNTALQDAATLLVSCFVACGDQWATDGESNGKANVNFPASSPWAIGCGGTTIDTSGGSITNETVWNDPSYGTGGGISDYFAEPAFQQSVPIPPSYNDHQVRRGVPDVAADADPSSGYNVVLNGGTQAYGGTSAVAPLWAGLTALVNQAAPQRVGFYMPQLYSNRQPMREILQGNNIAPGTSIGYSAGPIWNACTGLGVPNGAALMTLLAKPARAGTKLGGVQWTQQPQLRVYYQGVGNAILEDCWVGSSAWVPGATLPVAAPGSAISAVEWGNVQIRVYYQDANNVIQEYCWTGDKWTQGSTLPSAVAGTALASVAWSDVQIRVYYQDTNNVVQEYCWTGDKWTQGTTLPSAVAGTSLAAVAWGGVQVRVYYQDANNVIQEYCWTGDKWTQGATLPPARPGTALAAVAWGDVEIRVYYQDANNVIQEYCWTGSKWAQGATLPEAAPSSYLNALAWTDSSGKAQLRVYYEANGAIKEAVYGVQGWGTGDAYIPVAAGSEAEVATSAQSTAKISVTA